MTFLFPYAFLLLFLLPLIFGWYQREKQKNLYKFSSIKNFSIFKEDFTCYLHYLKPLLRTIVLFFIIIALSRPIYTKTQEKRTEGIDIAIVIDTSGSMDILMENLIDTRMNKVKEVVQEFIQNRPNDRIALSIFGTNTMLRVPLTLDHQVFSMILQDVETGIYGESTAIGDGLGAAVLALKDSQSPSKVLILLSDGENNAGLLSPTQAAETALAFDIRIHTIGLGSHGRTYIRNKQGRIQEVDENVNFEALEEIAKLTKGSFFKATSSDGLRKVYQDINAMEKASFEDSTPDQKTELFFIPLLLALFALLLEHLFSCTPWRRLSL